MAKKDKKKEKKEEPPDAVLQDEELLATTNLEPEPEEVQYTDTSYTSASFESLPQVIEEPKSKKKKGKKKAEEAEETVVRKTSSELFQWSEESLPQEEEKKVEEEQVIVKKKKGKKKKEEKEDIPDFEKPNNWKKMNKKEREAWQLERLEEWRAEMEAEKQAKLAGAKEKRLALARERAELMAKDNAEQEIRRDILAKTCNLFHKAVHADASLTQVVERQMSNAEADCASLSLVPRSRLHFKPWMERLRASYQNLFQMLEMLEEFVANSRQYTALQAQSYNEVRLALREQLSLAIQCASFTILRDLEHRLTWSSIKLATYHREFKGLKLNIWVAVPLPTKKPKPVESEPEPVELSFPSMSVAVKLPKIIDGSCVCVRAARSSIDLLSENSRSYHLLNEIPNRYEDLFIFNVKEHIETYKIKKEQDEIRNKFYKEIREKIKEVENFLKANPYTKNEKEKDELDNLNLAEPPFLPDPRTSISERNALDFTKYLKSCMTRTRTGEINLRKYR
ncbi:jg14793 [Pararge aegeria aegeria]|uniref:Jg14793 protein n=1 Tax=Pararge aegeria aegeria TaxID=348720 RepID=A0A8S4SN82_9NEOP|nr:jg14793 [Pararge aegeria aegeria]